MSSTNRSSSRNKHIADYYVTPISDIELFLKKFNEFYSLDWNHSKILDPCAGGNPKIRNDWGIKEAYHPMNYSTAIHNVFGKCNIKNIDIRSDSLAEIKGDYLTMDVKKFQPDIIITNPPFNLAVPIIEKAIDDVADNGYVIMLLRLNFFGSQSREEFFKKYKPESVFVHHIRIGFTDKKDDGGYTIFDRDGNPRRGSTDSIEYMHAVWHKGNLQPDYTKLILI